MSDEKSIFDPDVEKVSVEKVIESEPKTSTVLTTTDKPLFESIENFFMNLSLEDNPEYVVIIIIIIAVLCYVVYELFIKEGFKNPLVQNINFNDIDMYYINLDRILPFT